jgi:hypothetical protein
MMEMKCNANVEHTRSFLVEKVHWNTSLLTSCYLRITIGHRDASEPKGAQRKPQVVPPGTIFASGQHYKNI